MTRRGFTIIEALVCYAVLLMLSAIVVGIFWAAQTSLFHGTAHVDVQQKARQVVRTVNNLLITAVPPSGGQEAIYGPDLGTSASGVRFSTNQDLLGPAAVDPRAPTMRLYVIGLYGTDVRLEQVDPLPAPSPRVLANGVQSLAFRHSDSPVLEMKVGIAESYLDANRHVQSTDYSLETSIHLPYASMR